MSGEHPEKKWVDTTLKKSLVAPYNNLGRFYRAPFKSLLRLQIKRVRVKLGDKELFGHHKTKLFTNARLVLTMGQEVLTKVPYKVSIIF